MIIYRTIRAIICVETGNMYTSIKEASIKLGLSKGDICSVLKGTRKHTKGLTFKYIGE